MTRLDCETWCSSGRFKGLGSQIRNREITPDYRSTSGAIVESGADGDAHIRLEAEIADLQQQLAGYQKHS
jgi:hypothetical protein